MTRPPLIQPPGLQPGWGDKVPDPTETATLEVEVSPRTGRVTFRYQASAFQMPVYIPIWVPALKGVLAAILQNEARGAVYANPSPPKPEAPPQ